MTSNGKRKPSPSYSGSMKSKTMHIVMGLGLLGLLLLVRLGFQSQAVWQQYAQYEGLSQQAARLQNAPTILQQQSQTLVGLDKQVAHFQSVGPMVQSHPDFVRYLEGLCRQHTVNIVALPIEQEQTSEGYRLLEERFSLQGNFHQVLRVLHQLEQRDRMGQIQHLAFERKALRLQQGPRWILVADVILHRISRQENA